MKYTKFSLIIILFFVSFTFFVYCQTNQQKGQIANGKQVKDQSSQGNRQIGKFNRSTQLLASFLAKLTKNSYNFFALKITNECKFFKKSKIFQYMNSRIKNVKLNIKLLNKIGKQSEEERKQASNLMNMTILRIFREFFQNLMA